MWISPVSQGEWRRIKTFGFHLLRPEHTSNMAIGGGLHSSEKNATCGAHLCAILANGHVAKCGLFSQDPVGTIDEGLRVCWERIPRIQLKELTCNCPEIGGMQGRLPF